VERHSLGLYSVT